MRIDMDSRVFYCCSWLWFISVGSGLVTRYDLKSVFTSVDIAYIDLSYLHKRSYMNELYVQRGVCRICVRILVS